MQQKDYILREIEKIGILLRGILDKLTGKEEDHRISSDSQLENSKEELLQQAGFDLEGYLTLDGKEAQDYLEQFKGLHVENLEILAEIICQLGLISGPELKSNLYRRALEIFQWCKETDRSFSFEREARMEEIHAHLTSL